QMLDIVLVSNVHEGFEFLESYLTDYGFLLFMAAIAALLFMLYRLRKAVLVFIVIMIAASVPEIVISPQVFSVFYLTPDNAQYLGIGRIAMMTQEVRGEMSKYRALLDAKPQKVILTRNDSSIPHTVFILGEATARHHMSLYGYNLPTTPNLLRRKHEGGFYVFTDTVSPHSYTIIVLQKLFNFYRYGAKGEWFTYTNIFSILREAGCHTVWLTNQEVRPYYDPRTVYSGACDYAGYVEAKYNWDSGTAYDGELLPLLDDALKESAARNFYVIHLMGCHNTYSRRYPPEYAKFTASDETGGYEGITDSQKAHRAEYDNAELYNDYVVDQIIRRFEDKNAIVIYVSDHGQEVYDEVNIATHGGELPRRHIIEVPFIMWLSPKFRESYPELEARIASSVDRPYMTDDMIHTLLDIMSIETPEYDPAKSIINPKFDSSRPRIYSGMLYDKENGLHALQ
ncbi:MAG: phosphoethanolamine transferase, partial [Synergistaceae bacterium]|nr:phosphoethanolamine transferase [Synergistaceae bacterium]